MKKREKCVLIYFTRLKERRNKLLDNNLNKKKKSLSEYIRSSAIISFLMFIANWVYDKLESGFWGRIATSYDSENIASHNSGICTLFKKIRWSERVSRPLKHFIAKSIEQSFILSKIAYFTDTVLYSACKVHGVFFVSFGLYIEIVFFVKTSLSGNGLNGLDYTAVLIGAVLIIMALPLIFSNQTLADALKESRIMSVVIFDIIGASRESFSKNVTRKDHLYAPFIIGMVLGLLTTLIEPLYVILGIIGLIGAYAVLIIPEFGIFVIAVAAPFAPTMVLAALSVYVTLTFTLKFLCGKRSVKFSLPDAMIAVFAILTLLGGIVSPDPAGSIKPALIYTVFILGYFLCANLIRTKAWLNKCLYGMTLSLFGVSAYGVLQYVFGLGESTWHDEKMFSDISGRVVSTFENPNVLAEYLIMLIPLSLALTLISGGRSIKAGALITFAASLLCLVFTWSRGAWLGFLFSTVVFFLIYSKKIFALFVSCIVLIPFLPFVLPDSIINRFSSIGNLADTSTSYRFNIYSGVIRMLDDYWLSGIGTGLPAFSQVYPKYSLSGIESAPHSHNLFLQIITEHGAIALIVFLFIILLYTQSVFTFSKYETRKTKLAASALMCGVFAILIQGLTDYVWYNYRVYLIFWLVIGMTTAIRRCHRSTRT